jgi:hypothetical protein
MRPIAKFPQARRGEIEAEASAMIDSEISSKFYPCRLEICRNFAILWRSMQ